MTCRNIYMYMMYMYMHMYILMDFSYYYYYFSSANLREDETLEDGWSRRNELRA